MSAYPKLKVAAVQAAPVFLNLDETVNKTCQLVDEAAANGAKVIAFPEAFIPGYPWWIWLGNVNFGMKFYIELYKQAVEIPSKAVQKLSDAAKRNKVYFCVSVTEKDGASLYLTQLWFDPSGALIGKHRKLKPTNAEKTIWGDGDGSMMPVFETEYGNLGGLQCFEHMLPLNVAAMGSMNEQIHVGSWPIAMPQDGHLFATLPCVTAAKYYALTNQVFYLLSSMIWTDEQRDIICETEEQRKCMQVGYGFTQIIGPNGLEIGNHLAHDEEGISYADIDLAEIIPGKFLVDPSGHYSTPGFLSLTFDKSIHKAVKTVGESKAQYLSYEEIQFEEK